MIDFSGFDGQLTDVQMWDYPVSYREVFSYMTKGLYGYVYEISLPIPIMLSLN